MELEVAGFRRFGKRRRFVECCCGVVETEEEKDWEKVQIKGIDIGKWIRRKGMIESFEVEIVRNGPTT